MKRLCFIGALLIVCLLGIYGYSRRDSQPVIYEEADRLVNHVTLYVKDKITLGQYEPESGCYTGVYEAKEGTLAGNIKSYEQLVDQRQTFRILQYHHSQGIKAGDILECIASRKIPYIKVLFNGTNSLGVVQDLVNDLKSTFHTTVFIELFPITSSVQDVQTYKSIYLEAYKLLHDSLKDAVVVWGVDDNRVYDLPLYYPGDEYVDWAGINIYIPRYKNAELYVYDGKAQLEFWYSNFQQNKPMLISSLAISHFSRVDHTYTVYETMDKLSYFYEDVLSIYPRIRGILYVDVDMAKVTANGLDDYSISDQKELYGRMKTLFKQMNCLNQLAVIDEPEKTCDMKYSVDGAFFNDEFYIEEQCAKAIFKGVPFKELSVREDIKGNRYYSIKTLNEYQICQYKL